jgi:divalent metal cation (Fe/Co/Zn/Cd) transporter
MLKILGVIINLGIIAYLGFQAKSCLSPELLTDADIVRNPLILSFVAVIALFIALKN